jgi:hypothetical protein
MALRGLAGDMARNTAGIWKAVAEAVDPKPPRSEPKPEPEPDVEPAVEEPTIDIDAGQILVPIDAWTRILEQVGHVHEAGQQLADARERAARAETENDFLKEQLRDLKAQKRSPRRPAAPAEAASSKAATSDVAPPAQPGAASGRTRMVRVRAVVSRWLSPE